MLVDFADISDVHDVTNPLTKVKAGLVSNDNTPITLRKAHIRAKLIDLAGEVNSLVEKSNFEFIILSPLRFDKHSIPKTFP